MEREHPGVPTATEAESPDDDAGQGIVIGELEDDRLKAVVSATDEGVTVTFEGRLDASAAPVVDELLDAVSRWHRRADRGKSRDPVAREDGGAAAAAPGATLVLDVRRTVMDRAGWQVLAGHRDRWIRERGPCRALRGTSSAQWSNR